MKTQCQSQMKTSSIALYTLLRREIVRMLRIWSQTFLPSVMSMTLYFVIFGNLIGNRIGEMGGASYIEYLVPGLIMMSIITNSYGNVVASFFGAKFQKHIEEMLVAPMPNCIILWGFLLGGVIRGIGVGVLVTLVSLLFTRLNVHHYGLTFLMATLTALLFSLAGFINAIYAKTFDDINFVPTFILNPLTYLAGVFYSVSLLPPFWKTLTYANPVFYIVNAFRFSMLGISEVSVQMSIGVLICLIIALYGFSAWLLKKGIGLKN